jgi:hypothetical protein
MNRPFDQRLRTVAPLTSTSAASVCGLPVDAEHFDSSSIQPRPAVGHEMLLARFELQPQYCGWFENFAQFVGKEDGEGLAVVDTPGLQWLLLVNHRPLFPYVELEHIVNPWGFGGFPVSIRLDDLAVVELLVRNRDYPDDLPIKKVGGRITGRFWYNPAYGDARVWGAPFQ